MSLENVDHFSTALKKTDKFDMSVEHPGMLSLPIFAVSFW